MLRHRFVSPTKVLFESPDRDKISGWRYASARFPPGVPQRFLKAIIEAVEKLGGRLAIETMPKLAKAMSEILVFLTRNDVFVDTSFNWNEILYLHLLETLENKKVEQRTRVMKWQSIQKIYKELARFKAIPSDVLVPSGTVRGGCAEDALAPIGHKRKVVDIPKTIEDLRPKHALIAKGLELDDDEFVENLKNRFQNGVDVCIELLTGYWDRMRNCWEIGRTLLLKVPTSALEERLAKNDFFENGQHVAHPAAPDGIAWFLRAIQYYALTTYELDKINFNQMCKLPFFKDLLEVKGIESVILQKLHEVSGDSAPPVHKANKQPTELISRLLQLLSKRDSAAACCILILENPSFTSDSIANADLYTQNGKLYLKAQTLHRRLIFSVSKPRARKRKVSVLSPLSARVVKDVVQATSQIRERQKFLQKRNWRKLFLISTRNQIGSISRPSSILSTGSGITLYSLFQARLKQVDIDHLSFNLSTLRSTQAILCFLKHGSIKMVADLLNNSVQVVKKNYIPVWMIIYWGNRILRTIQQKIIVVATEGSSWQLEASDFLDASSLRKFITKILRDLKNGDAFSEIIRVRLGKYASEPLAQPYREAELLIPMGVEELAFLYAYADVVRPANFKPVTSDDGALSDKQIRSLVELIRQCDRIHDGELSDAEYAVLAKISGDSLMQFQRIHLAATTRADALKSIFREKLPNIEQRGDS
ncbi:hypothetical protein [Pseudomonas sp. BF-B-25]|uniref:hypothetical protein n=1 Tax=Pseudomonas sp. BF-B-25 TaxID=2832355 RepID=UPI001CBF3F9C|nr:hypothetical protein [Pseudomonas sp. BF-B-25]